MIESEKENLEINIERVKEIEDLDPDKVVSACPFCLTMLNDGIKSKNLDNKIKVIDITELIAENLEE